MGVYNGTGYFIPTQDLENIKLASLEQSYPKIKQLLLKEENAAASPDNLLQLLQLAGLATTESILQYDEAVSFVGDFKKYFDEDDLDPDSGDAEMVQRLKSEDGYDYAVSNENELTHSLETVNAILENYGLIGDHDVLENYWFLAPFGA
ncbi:MAG: hypothetical protein Q4C55_05945 [Eubacterium sp.]|nr:hypothetical protein [Eubacterium sp.]